MIDGGPFHGGASAELIIDDKAGSPTEIVRGFQAIVCVASRSEAVGELKFQLIHAENGRLGDLLLNSRVVCIALPLLVLGVKDYPTPDAAPKPVS
jgi:hypothetical protein